VRASYTSRETRDIWALLTGYERFEQAVSLALTALISVLIIVTILGLTYRVCTVVVFEIIDPNQMEIFQSIFGMVMTVLIDLGACCLPRQVTRIQDRPPVERQSHISRLDLPIHHSVASGLQRSKQGALQPRRADRLLDHPDDLLRTDWQHSGHNFPVHHQPVHDELDSMAKPTLADPLYLPGVKSTLFVSITSPARLNNGPPELP
jgi:hypothetical protein